MATKTLGIRFEVAGVKEAQASLGALQKNVAESIASNQKQINTAINNAQVENSRVLYRIKNNQLYRYLNREKNKLDRDLKESYKLNFGTKTEKQNTIIRQEKRDFAASGRGRKNPYY